MKACSLIGIKMRIWQREPLQHFDRLVNECLWDLKWYGVVEKY